VDDRLPAIVTKSAFVRLRFSRYVFQADAPLFAGFASALFLIASLALSGCSNTRSAPTTARAAAGQAVPVGVATAERRDMPVYLTGLGSVTAFNTVSVRRAGLMGSCSRSISKKASM